MSKLCIQKRFNKSELKNQQSLRSFMCARSLYPILIFWLFSITSVMAQDASSTIDLSSPPLDQPTPEVIPQPSDILSPLTNLISGFSFSLPAHDSVCFEPTITIFDTDFVMDQPCLLIAPYQSFINLVGLSMWAVLAFLIVMSA